MPKAQRKTQVERRQQSQQSLLTAAIDVIADEGVSAVTFEALARSSGFSRGLATQHFGSKQNLIDTLLQQLSERQDTLYRELDDKPGLDAVKSYVDRSLQSVMKNKHSRVYFMLLASSIADASSMRSAFQVVHADAADKLEGWIEKGQASGAVRADIDAGAAALMVGCLLFGFSMQLLVNPAMDLTGIRKSCLKIVQASLASPSIAKAGANAKKARTGQRLEKH